MSKNSENARQAANRGHQPTPPSNPRDHAEYVKAYEEQKRKNGGK